MAGHVCPWWGGYFIDNRFRRLLHDPAKIVGPYLREGMTALDIGCGMGFFSIAMAQRVGPSGRVIAVDLQPQMLDVLMRRAAKAGVAARIRPRRCEADRLGVDESVDFALAFAMVHEVPDPRKLLAEVTALLAPAGALLVAEPRLHVSGKTFGRMVATAEEVGLHVAEEPHVRWCRAVTLTPLSRPTGEGQR